MHFRDHLSDVGVLNRLFLFTSSPNKTDPSSADTEVPIAPALEKCRMLCPVTFDEKITFYITYPLTPSEEGNSCHVLRWRAKETTLTQDDKETVTHQGVVQFHTL